MRAMRAMRAYGTNVIGGVTPRKGGQIVEGVPVWNTISEAIREGGPINMVVQFVPQQGVLNATKEALDFDIPFILVGAEKVPIHDTIHIHRLANKKGAILIGPGSVGMIVPHLRLKIGMIGGDTPERVFAPGRIAILSKSGGMTSEIALALKQSGLGVSLACGVGGERITGSDFADLLIALENDESTAATIIFGEVGGFAEERVAEKASRGLFKKPIIALTVGEFIANLSHEAPFGHTGAIMENGHGGVLEKRDALRRAGVHVVERLDEIAPLLVRLSNNELS